MNIHVNVTQTKNPNGWTASIARSYAPQGANSAVAIGESAIYPSKNAAWDTIKIDAKRLDFKNDDVYLNHKKVNDYNDLEIKVAAL